MKLAGKHGTPNPATQMDVMFLQPSDVKHRIVREPVPVPILKEQPELVPLSLIQLKTVDNDYHFPGFAAKLDEPQFAHFGLQLERLGIKGNGNRRSDLVEVLDPEKHVVIRHGWSDGFFFRKLTVPIGLMSTVWSVPAGVIKTPASFCA